MYEVFEHTADLGLRVRAATREELFAEAAQGLFAMIVANLDTVEPVQSRTLEVQGDDDSLLMFDWLNELLYAFESDRMLLSRFEVEMTGGQIRAVCWGEPMDSERHEMEHEVKAITYHQLRVEPDADGWIAEIIVDI
jgi:SHS2 domain-containing protein